MLGWKLWVGGAGQHAASYTCISGNISALHRDEFPYFRSAPDGWKVRCLFSLSQITVYIIILPLELHTTQSVPEPCISQGEGLDEVAGQEGFLLGGDS